MTEPQQPLDGIRIGVTSSRKGAELVATLERRGAAVLHGPTIEPDQPAPDQEILRGIDAILAEPPDWFAATTGVGLRFIARVADEHGRGEQLRDTLTASRVVARGAKAVGGLRALDLAAEFVSSEETDADLAAWLGGHVGRRQRVAVQCSGRTSAVYRSVVSDLALLQEIEPYRTGIPTDDSQAVALVRAAVAVDLDLVTFTSATAVDHLLTIAERHGLDVVSALRDTVAVASIGAVTTDALTGFGISPDVVPGRHRTGPFVRAIEQWASGRESLA